MTDAGLPAVSLCPSCGNEVGPTDEFCSSCGRPLPTSSVERTLVSILYVDVGSDETLDTERFQMEQQIVIDEISSLAGTRGGRTEGVRGDLVEIVFAVPFARMPARDALHVAERLRKILIERFGRRDWRMAIATGIGAREGDVLVTAASMRARALVEGAAIATIEIDDETRRFELTDPTRVEDRLLGRDRERASIEGAFLASVAQRKCHRMLLLAEPGIGKSRLAEESLRKVEGRADTQSTKCQPWGEASLAPLEHVMRKLIPGLREDPEEATKELLADQDDREVIVEQICRLFGWGDAPDVPDVSVWSVRRLLEQLSMKWPIVLMFDDLHWAEDPLLDALEDLSSRLTGPVLLLCAARPDLIRRRPDFALQESNIHVRKLEPMDREEAIGLVEAVLGGPVDQGPWIDGLLSAAQGSPLFLVEALSQMRASDELVVRGGFWGAADEDKELAMSPTIETLLGARVTSLSHTEREAIEAAAVWGIDFEVDQLQALIPRSRPTELLARFARLQASDFVEAGAEVAGSPTFRIRHALIRDAAYELCTKDRRAELHQNAAVYCEQKQLPESLIGHHWEQSVRFRRELWPTDPTNAEVALRAAQALSIAGRDERARGAPGTAVEFYERALSLRPERDAAWVEDAIDMAECLLNLGNRADAARISDEVRAVAGDMDDPLITATSQLMDARLKTHADFTDPEIEETLRGLLPIFEERNDDKTLVKIYRAIAEWNWNRMMAGPTSDAMSLALEHCLKTPERLDLAHLLSGLAATTLFGPTPVSLGKIVCERLLTIAAGDPFARAQVNLRMGALEALSGDFHSARDRARNSHGILVELGREMWAATSTHEMGLIELFAGDFQAARAIFKNGYDELGRLSLPDFQATCAAWLARTLYELRHSDEALEYIKLAEDQAQDDPQIAPETFPLKALIAADHGDGKQAVELLEKARDAVYKMDSLTTQAQVELQATRVFRKLGLSEEATDAFMKARSLCEEKEAPALLALIDLEA